MVQGQTKEEQRRTSQVDYLQIYIMLFLAFKLVALLLSHRYTLPEKIKQVIYKLQLSEFSDQNHCTVEVELGIQPPIIQSR